MAISGHCAPRFSQVREVFERHFAEGEELGAAYAVFLHGEPVVDLWGGLADRHTARPWEADTPALAYSCAKAVTATALLLLADRGLLDVTAPVSRYWPEFAANGKSGVTVEHVLSHQAGLPAIEETVPVDEYEDLPAIAGRLARQAPVWEPGAAHGYHPLTYGFLVGEIIRRVTGESAGDLISAEIAGPRGLSLWLGAPPDVIQRTARLSTKALIPNSSLSSSGADPDAISGGDSLAESGASGEPVAAAPVEDGLLNRALGNPRMRALPGGANNPVILRAGWPALGMVATARGLAGFYRDLIAGDILKPTTLTDAIRRRVKGPDRVLPATTSFGLGYMRPAELFSTPERAAQTAFGHTGMGGFMGLADRENGLAIAYIMNRTTSALTGASRAYRLTDATYDCLA